jgi:4,5-DOPA dioxygenase extradiol
LTHHVALGRALAALSRDGVLVIGSGSITHNLRQMLRDEAAAAPVSWAAQFVQWMRERLREADLPGLLEYRSRAPHAALAHPTDDHLLPLFFAIGAGSGEAGFTTTVHDAGFTYGSLGMDAYAFQPRP